MTAEEASSRLKGTLWNEMLTLYLRVFYLSCLEQLVKWNERKNDVVVLLAKMMCCCIPTIIIKSLQ